MLASKRSPEGQALLLLGWTQALLGTQHQTKSYTQCHSSESLGDHCSNRRDSLKLFSKHQEKKPQIFKILIETSVGQKLFRACPQLTVWSGSATASTTDLSHSRHCAKPVSEKQTKKIRRSEASPQAPSHSCERGGSPCSSSAEISTRRMPTGDRFSFSSWLSCQNKQTQLSCQAQNEAAN